MQQKPATSRRSVRHHFAVERLEDRRMMTSDWQNASLACDVDGSQLVTPYDVLALINSINRDGDRTLPTRDSNSTAPMYDVDGDSRISHLDVLSVINAINRAMQELELTSAPDAMIDVDGNGVIEAESLSITGQTSSGSQILVRVWSDTPLPSLAPNHQVTVTADAAGHFATPIPLSMGLNRVQFTIHDELGRSVDRFVEVRRGDIFTQWNSTLLNLARRIGGGTAWTVEQSVATKPPGFARNLAMIYTAMYDAIHAIEGSGSGIMVTPSKVPGANASAAAVQAAYRVAYSLYPDATSRQELDRTRNESLGTPSSTSDFLQAIELGNSVGDAVLSLRANDGAVTHVDYSEAAGPGVWQPKVGEEVILPQWSMVQPFVIHSAINYRAPTPPALSSAEYATAVGEVQSLGSKLNSTRTSDQTEIAFFWADGAGSGTPPGHWNQIAVDTMSKLDMSLMERARTMALLNLALADAGIVSWDNKFEFNLWRPYQAIQGAASDGNNATVADPAWEPLLKTPSFPSYTSGHSTFSGAAAEILKQTLGENLSFVSAKDAYAGWRVTQVDPRETDRYFSHFQEAADEAGMSRIYGGIHYSFDNTAGLITGQAVAQAVLVELNA